MAFIDKLKGIIPPSLFSTAYYYDVKLDFSKGLKGGIAFKEDKEHKLLIIYVYKLSPKEEALLIKLIKKEFSEDKATLVQGEAMPLLDKLYQYNSKDDNQILTFFKPVLSRMDWEALRDSLFLRSEFRKHENVTVLKANIASRYGERGNIISNMCTAGYFEETMIPLFNNSQKEFYRYWDIAIDRGVATLFVNAGMTIKKIKDEINRRLVSAKLYGLRCIHIHGIGVKNVKNIKACIENEKEKLSFTEKNIFTDEGLNVLVVEIIL